jgi:hypothetical protein
MTDVAKAVEAMKANSTQPLLPAWTWYSVSVSMTANTSR